VLTRFAANAVSERGREFECIIFFSERGRELVRESESSSESSREFKKARELEGRETDRKWERKAARTHAVPRFISSVSFPSPATVANKAFSERPSCNAV